MERLGFLFCLVLFTGCAFGEFPDTHSKDFWIALDKRIEARR